MPNMGHMTKKVPNWGQCRARQAGLLPPHTGLRGHVFYWINSSNIEESCAYQHQKLAPEIKP